MADRSNQQTTGTPPGVEPVEPEERARGTPREAGLDSGTRVGETELRARQQGEEPRTTDAQTAEGARTEAQDRTQELGEKAKEKGEQLRADAEDTARALGSKARRKVEEAGQAAGRSVADGASRTGERLRSVAGALRAASDRLDEEGEGWLAGYARETASRVDRMSGYLGQGDASRMMSDLEEQARSHPGMFVGGTVATGFAVGRFLRASERRARSSQRADSGQRQSVEAPVSAGTDTLEPPATPPGPTDLPPERGPTAGSRGPEGDTVHYPGTSDLPGRHREPDRPGGAGAP